MQRGDYHAAGVYAHHLPRREVGDGQQGLADKRLRLVVVVDAAEYDAVFAGAVVEHELEQLLALLDGLARLDLDHAEVAPAEGLKVHKVGEQRLDCHLGEISGSQLVDRHALERGREHFAELIHRLAHGGSVVLLDIQRLHRGDVNTTRT